MAAAVSKRSKYLNSAIQILTVALFCFSPAPRFFRLSSNLHRRDGRHQTGTADVAGWAGGRAGGASQALMSRNINDKVISQLFLPAEAALQFHPSHSLL